MLGVDVRHDSLHCVGPQLHEHLLAAGMHQLLGRQLRRVAGEAVGQAAAPPLQGGGTAAQAVAGASPRAGRGAASPSCAPGRSCSETCANCGRWIRGSLRCSDGVMQQPGPQNSAKTAGEGADGSIWECPPAFLGRGPFNHRAPATKRAIAAVLLIKRVVATEVGRLHKKNLRARQLLH